MNRLDITLRQQPVTFAIDDKQNTSVAIGPLSAEQKQRYGPRALLCSAVTQRQPEPDIDAIFVRLADDLMPEDFKPSKQQQDIKHIDATGRITKGHSVSLKLFPKPFQEFCLRVHHELSESIRRAIKIMRWRMGSYGSHNPIASSHGDHGHLITRLGDYRLGTYMPR